MVNFYAFMSMNTEILTDAFDLPVHVGASELHDPVVEVPSPVHSTAVVLDRPKPLVHVNVHELPWLLELEHVGALPLAGLSVESAAGQVISENRKETLFFINK